MPRHRNYQRYNFILGTVPRWLFLMLASALVTYGLLELFEPQFIINQGPHYDRTS